MYLHPRSCIPSVAPGEVVCSGGDGYAGASVGAPPLETRAHDRRGEDGQCNTGLG